jgi:hypothetical protein
MPAERAKAQLGTSLYYEALESSSKTPNFGRAGKVIRGKLTEHTTIPFSQANAGKTPLSPTNFPWTHVQLCVVGKDL